jgi:hypothetical protein
MPEKDLNQKDEHEIISDKDIVRLMLIVKEHKVLWMVIPIELVNSEGKTYQAGFTLALAGIAPGREENLHDSSEGNVFKDLREIANWLVPKDNSNIHCEIEAFDNFFFYVPGDIDPERRDYAVAISIWNKEGKNKPVDIHQTKALKEMEEKLKQIGSPKERWKEQKEYK